MCTGTHSPLPAFPPEKNKEAKYRENIVEMFVTNAIAKFSKTEINTFPQ